LLSDTIDASDIKVGHVYLTIDLKHDYPSIIDNEFFIVSVGNDTIWNLIDTIHYYTDFHWTTFKYDISNYAITQIFQLKFEAVGDITNSSWTWNSDNIEIYAECDKPKELEGDVYYKDGVMGSLIKWKAPKSIYHFEGWKHWDSGNNFSAIGNDCGKCQQDVAARWDPEMLYDIDNDTIEKIRFFINGEYSMDLIPKVWLGSNPPNLIYSDTITDIAFNNEWVKHDLSQTIIIDKSLEYWVGYEAYLNYPGSGAFPIGIDEGPAITGYGDMIKITDMWEPLSELGIDYNFNIQMYVDKVAESDPSQLLGFNIHVMYWGASEFQLLDFVDFVDTKFEYNILDTCNLTSCNAIYKVNAVLAKEGDTCVSSFANSKLFPDDDYVFILYEGMENQESYNKISLYPNPAHNQLNIKSDNKNQNIEIYNAFGQIV
jgi:hypothetical protein